SVLEGRTVARDESVTVNETTVEAFGSYRRLIYRRLSTVVLSTVSPISRRSRDSHLSHHPVSKPGFRCELEKVDQLENHVALALGLGEAQGAVGKMHGSGGGEETLRPELDFVGCEMHGGVGHWVSYGPVQAPVSVSAIFQITTQFITGPMDIRFHGSQREFEGVRDLLIGIPLHVP